ncbi:MAG: PIN domain-containing protein [Nanoarchaeota archaeon]
MKVVLDSNVLFRTLISGGEIIRLIFNKNLELFTPQKIKEEFLNNRKEILSRSKISELGFNKLISSIFKIVKLVPSYEYKEFIPKSKELLKKHVKDVEFVALALKLNCLIWTYEKLIFDKNLGISTKQISNELNKLDSK